jgi:hypothetical protein
MGTGFASDGKDFGYLFGGAQGFFGFKVTGYLYRFNLRLGNATKISGGTVFDGIPSSLPQIGIPSNSGPPPKEAPALWFSRFDNSLYTFGGFSSYRNCFGNDFWRYNLSDGKWSWLSGDLNCSVNPRLPQYGTYQSFNSGSHPGARMNMAFWENQDQARLYFFGGNGAYFGSITSVASYAPTHVNQFWYWGSDLWAYDVRTMNWAWVSGLSIPWASPISDEPQAPGFETDLTFGKSNSGDLWLLGRGKLNSYWLWKFNTDNYLWTPFSQIGTGNTPKPRLYGSITQIGTNLLILTAGYNLSDSNYRYQDVWSFYIPSKRWNQISGST